MTFLARDSRVDGDRVQLFRFPPGPLVRQGARTLHYDSCIRRSTLTRTGLSPDFGDWASKPETLRSAPRPHLRSREVRSSTAALGGTTRLLDLSNCRKVKRNHPTRNVHKSVLHFSRPVSNVRYADALPLAVHRPNGSKATAGLGNENPRSRLRRCGRDSAQLQSAA